MNQRVNPTATLSLVVPIMINDTPRAFRRSPSLSSEVSLACTVVGRFLEVDQKILKESIVGVVRIGLPASILIKRWFGVRRSRFCSMGAA